MPPFFFIIIIIIGFFLNPIHIFLHRLLLPFVLGTFHLSTAVDLSLHYSPFPHLFSQQRLRGFFSFHRKIISPHCSSSPSVSSVSLTPAINVSDCPIQQHVRTWQDCQTDQYHVVFALLFFPPLTAVITCTHLYHAPELP